MASNAGPPERRAWLGAALFAAVVACAAVIFFLDDIVEATRDTTTVTAVLEGAPKLRRGAAVWIAGRPVGRVRNIEILPSNDTIARVAAVLRMSASARDQIRADAAVRVTSARRIGEPTLDILPGSPAVPPLPPGDTLYEHAGITFDHVIARAGALTAGIDSLAAAAAALRGPFSQTVLAAGRILDHAEAARNEFALIASAADAGAFAILDDPAVGRAITSLRTAGHALQAGLDRSAGPRAEIGVATSALRERIDRLVARLDTLDALTEHGTIARIRGDAAITNALHAVRAQLDSLIAEAKANPLRFVF